MIDRKAVLVDLQKVVSALEKDLRARCDELTELDRALRAEHAAARAASRTAEAYEVWRGEQVTQTAVAWVLSCVFARFLEDNGLIDPPRIAGPEQRGKRARDEHEMYFRRKPKETAREYLLSVFAEMRDLPGTKDLFSEHNPVQARPGWLRGDAARHLIDFFQKI